MNEGRIAWRGTALIAIVYFYFLIFAQFAFLKLLAAANLKATMAAMGLAGLLGSLATPLLLRRYSWEALLRAGFIGCALAAGCALTPIPSLLWIAVAAVIGVSLGFVTVTLVSQLRDLLGECRWGITIGAGTGLAYCACNVPVIFQASPSAQTIAAGFAALFGIFLTPSRGRSTSPELFVPATTRLAFGSVLIIFTMLIWLDSAAFFIIQNSGALLEGTWGGSSLLWRNALVHLGAALTAGWWMEKQRSLAPAALAFVLLALAAWLVNAKDTLWLGGALYPAGVSLYSTCLVAFPAYVLATDSPARRRWLAAVLYAVAGWLGSGMGIGMAENLHAVPAAFILVAALLVGAAFGFPLYKHRLREIAACASLLVVALALSGGQVSGRASQTVSDSVDRGREVYLSEGCIHCHSRYVRPQAEDTLMWGPYVSYQEALQEEPPLFGNRRHGPDLSNVGMRRSRDWLKLHFIEPRLLAPNTSMPKYAHLFTDERGDDLLDYLMQTHSSIEERLETVQAWQLPPATPAGEMAQRWRLYQKHCLTCHGASGQGDGALGLRLVRRPSNLRQGPFIHSANETAIPRIIKFGVVGTDMPGHEYLNDEDIAALSAYVKCLRISP